jgi:hypothetical protein
MSTIAKIAASLAVLSVLATAPASAQSHDREHLSAYPDFGRTPAAVWFGQGGYSNRADR